MYVHTTDTTLALPFMETQERHKGILSTCILRLRSEYTQNDRNIQLNTIGHLAPVERNLKIDIQKALKMDQISFIKRYDDGRIRTYALKEDVI